MTNKITLKEALITSFECLSNNTLDEAKKIINHYFDHDALVKINVQEMLDNFHVPLNLNHP